MTSGGEPFLCPSVMETIARYSDEAKASVTVSTSGMVHSIPPAVLHAARRRRIGVCVSLDGPDSQSDGLTRGNLHFGRATSFVASLAKSGVSPVVLCCVHRGNLGRAISTGEAARRWGARSTAFLYYVPVGRGWLRMPNESLALREWESFVAAAAELVSSGGAVAAWEAVFLPSRSVPDPCRERRSMCLAAQGKMLSVAADGTAYPCVLLTSPRFALGRVDAHQLSDLYEASRETTTNLLRRMHAVCQEIPDCTGGCPYFALTFCDGGCDPRCEVSSGFVPICPLIWASPPKQSGPM